MAGEFGQARNRVCSVGETSSSGGRNGEVGGESDGEYRGKS